MKTFPDLNRNVTFSENYDEQSFIGKWLDYGVWNDKEYWKLDRAFEDIKSAYPFPHDIPREIAAGIFRIAEIMMVPNWEAFSVETCSDTCNEAGIFERFERLKVRIRCIFTGESVDNADFDYRY